MENRNCNHNFAKEPKVEQGMQLIRKKIINIILLKLKVLLKNI